MHILIDPPKDSLNDKSRCMSYRINPFHNLNNIWLKRGGLLGLFFQVGELYFCKFTHVIFTRCLANQWLQLVFRDLYQFNQLRHYFFFLNGLLRTLTSTYAEEYQRSHTEYGHCSQHVKNHSKSTITSTR